MNTKITFDSVIPVLVWTLYGIVTALVLSYFFPTILTGIIPEAGIILFFVVFGLLDRNAHISNRVWKKTVHGKRFSLL